MRSLSRHPDRGFSFVEVLVALALLACVLVATLVYMDNVDRVWRSTAVDAFEEAQDAFDLVAGNLAHATLAPYQDYADSGGSFRTSTAFVPDHLAQRSDLSFVCGPSAGTGGLLGGTGRTTTGCAVFFAAANGFTQTAAHEGMAGLLNAIGYYVEFGPDDSAPPFAVAQRWRWRLKQVMQPSEALQIFATTTSATWIAKTVPTGATEPVLAENIVTLLVLPEGAAGSTNATSSPTYVYDSRDTTSPATLHQLPARLRLILVAMDEASATIVAAQNGTAAPALVPSALFQQPAQVTTDLATLDADLTALKIEHHIYQRDILLPAQSW